MRFNIASQKIEVFDGNSWIAMGSSSAAINLTDEEVSILDWAKKKKAEELERELLAESNPTIKDLVNQIKEKEEQIKMVRTLLNSPGHDEEQPVAMQAP